MEDTEEGREGRCHYLVLACEGLVDAHALNAVSGLDSVLCEGRGGREGGREGRLDDEQARDKKHEPSTLLPSLPPSLPLSLHTTKSYSNTRLILRGICPNGARSGISCIVTLWWSLYVDSPYSVSKGLPSLSLLGYVLLVGNMGRPPASSPMEMQVASR